MTNPPKPTALKMLQGNPGRRPLNKWEPKVPKGEVPKPPKWLSAFGKKMFKEVGSKIVSYDLVSTVDWLSLAGLADLIDLWQQLNELWNDPDNKPLMIDSVVDSAGRERITAKKNPLFAMKMDVYLRLQPYFAMFGLSPKDRASLKVLPKKLEDDFEAFLSEKASK